MRPTHLIHLVASPFFGGPERQMLGLARGLPSTYRSTFLTFPERGLCQPFVDQLEQHGFEAVALRHNAPRFAAAVQEVTSHLRRLRADVLLTHGYKPDLLGLLAARNSRIPIVSVSRGWTGATFKVRVYDTIDRLSLHAMDAIVCVSEGQATKVRQAGVPAAKVHVIRNAIQVDRFANADPGARNQVLQWFPTPPRHLVVAAGRLSPEKGLGVLVDAAKSVLGAHQDVGFVVFGEGPLHRELTAQIESLGLRKHFVLAGFRGDLDRLLPAFDLLVLPSFTEGLPNVALEACAAGVPVVGTAVGGTPEVIEHGENGYLVPPGDPAALASRILELLRCESARRAMGDQGRQRVALEFTFTVHCNRYQRLFESLVRPKEKRRPREPACLAVVAE